MKTNLEKTILSMGNETILILEDEKILLEVFTEQIEDLGYIVIGCLNGIEGLKVFSDNYQKIDLLITDQKMPKMSGIELIYTLRNKGYKTPILIYSGSSSFDEEKLNKLNIYSKLIKPVKSETLANTIRNCLDNNSQTNSYK